MTRDFDGKFSSHEWLGFEGLDRRMSDNAIWYDQSSLIESSDDGVFHINFFYRSFGIYGSEKFYEIAYFNFFVGDKHNSCDHIFNSCFHGKSDAE